MAIDTNAIKVTAETTLDEVLDAVERGEVRVERDGVIYIIQVSRLYNSDEWDEELAERQRKALRESAGIWKDIDTKEVFADFYRRRGQEPPARDPK